MAREKEVIENQLEAEQEYIVNKLQKQAMGLAAEKQALQLEKADLKRQVRKCCKHASLQQRDLLALDNEGSFSQSPNYWSSILSNMLQR
jgi:coiled-coil domain-containing protein 6